MIIQRQLFAVTAFVFSCTLAIAADSDGSYSGFRKHNRTASKPYSYNVVSAPGHPVREGRKSFRFELRNGDCAAEDCRTDRERVERWERGSSKVGQEYWYSYSIYLDPSFKPASGISTILGQFKQEPVGPQIASLEAEHGRLVFLMKNVATKQDRGDLLIDKPIASLSSARGRWIDLAFHVKWAADKNGLMEVYVDGKRKISFVGRTAYTKRDLITFRFGIYRGHVSRVTSKGKKMPTLIVYYDNVKRGKSYESVKP